MPPLQYVLCGAVLSGVIRIVTAAILAIAGVDPAFRDVGALPGAIISALVVGCVIMMTHIMRMTTCLPFYDLPHASPDIVKVPRVYIP